MAERSELALNEEAGMRLAPDTGDKELWVTRLKGPHPSHVSVAAGALMTRTSSRTHAYMLAYTLDDAGLLDSVSGSDGTQVAGEPEPTPVFDPKTERVIRMSMLAIADRDGLKLDECGTATKERYRDYVTAVLMCLPLHILGQIGEGAPQLVQPVADSELRQLRFDLQRQTDLVEELRKHLSTQLRTNDRERATRETLQLIVNEAGEALRQLADQNPWEQPPSLMDRIELVGSRLASAVVVPEGWRQSMLLCLKAFEDEPWNAKVDAIGELLETWRTGEGNDRDVELPAVSLHSGTENEIQPRWRTHPGTGVMHLLLPGTTRAICNAAESYAWRAGVDGNAKHTVCNELAGSASTAEEER